MVGEVVVGAQVERTQVGPFSSWTIAGAAALGSIVDRLQRSTAADRTVSEFAAADMAANFDR